MSASCRDPPIQHLPNPRAWMGASVQAEQRRGRHRTTRSVPTERSWRWSLTPLLLLQKIQRGFREMVRARDIFCLISGEFMLTCDAAHLVPKARDDVSVCKHSHHEYRSYIFSLKGISQTARLARQRAGRGEVSRFGRFTARAQAAQGVR